MKRDSEERITSLEIQLAHSQHLLEQLNEVVTEQGGKMDRMMRTIQRLHTRIDELKHGTEEKRDPLDEKPPHY